MPTEIEAKMKVDDADAVRRRIEALGATPTGHVRENNMFFDTPDERLRQAGQGLRLRTEQNVEGQSVRAVVTHKGALAPGQVKTRPETEFGVDDADAVAQVFTALGYAKFISFEKLRRKWTLDECEVVLDRLPYLGDFVEVEGPDEQTVLEVRRKLGLAEAPLIRDSYLGMLMGYMKDHGIRERHIALDAT